MMIILALSTCACSLTKVSRNSKKSGENTGFSTVRDDGYLAASFFAFDTYMTVIVYEDKDGQVDEKELQVLADEAKRLEKIFSTTDKESEIYRFNQRSTDRVKLSEEALYLFDRTKEIYERTFGALDATAYPLVKAWGFTTGEHRIPSEDELKKLLAHVGMEKIRAAGSELIAEKGTELDFGAVAKGYLSNVLARMLKDMGAEHAMLDLGGNIEVIGTKEDGSMWRIGIKDPTNDTGIIGSVSVSDKAVVTSGGYERYFTDDAGNVYWHILDPSTGSPARSGVISATVVGDDATLCDALSTAFFVMGVTGAADYYDTYGGIEYILVMEDGSRIVSEGLEEVFTAADSSAVE